MVRPGSDAKTSIVSCTTTTTTTPVRLSDISGYCPDLENWPGSWMGWDKDLPPGERLVACFWPFIQHVEISS